MVGARGEMGLNPKVHWSVVVASSRLAEVYEKRAFCSKCLISNYTNRPSFFFFLMLLSHQTCQKYLLHFIFAVFN